MAAWSSDSYSIFMREDYTSKTIAWVKLTATNIFEQLPPQSIIIIKVYHRISLLPNVTPGNLVLGGGDKMQILDSGPVHLESGSLDQKKTFL